MSQEKEIVDVFERVKITTERDRELAITSAKNRIQMWKEAEDRLAVYKAEYRKFRKQAERELKKAEEMKIPEVNK